MQSIYSQHVQISCMRIIYDKIQNTLYDLHTVSTIYEPKLNLLYEIYLQ
jgi:hypothetical protein